MIIKSISGKILARTNEKTMKRALEYCAAHGISLPAANLRKARLSMTNLDGLKAAGASFWGADLTGTDMGFADLRGCDFRCSELKDACLAQSDLTNARLEGAYFSGTLLEGCVLDNVTVSCPSFWNCDLSSAASMRNLRYLHKGERTLNIQSAPVIIRGLPQDIILYKNHCQWGPGLYPSGLLPRQAQHALMSVKDAIDKMLSRNARRPIPKIAT